MTTDERASSRTVQGADTVALAGSDEAEARVAGQIGSNIARYVVLAEVGRGGMGRVLRAYDPKLQREVALKEVRSRLLGAIGARRLVAEARAMAKLAHPNVVAVYDVEELAQDQVVVVMEYVAGRTLTKWADGRTWQEIVACFRRAGRGLAAAHAAGLLHRDFKPDNVLIADGNVVKVTDFGLAKLASDDVVAPSHEHDADADGLTATGVVLGTPRFMAPEQHRGEQLGPAADQYAFCVALWFSLTGRAPFDGNSLEEIERAKTKGPPSWPGGPTPRAIVDAIQRGLAPDPARRWPSMDALLDALAFDPARRRRRWLRAGAAIAVVGAAATLTRTYASDRARRCSTDAAVAQLSDAWDDARRSEVKAALLGVDAVYSAAVWTRTQQKLDDYADAWTKMHVESCAATTLRGEQSPAVMDLRMACLHRAKVELAATTRVLAEADAKTVQKAHELLGSLRRLERCADVPALQAEVEPPLPEEADAVEAVRAELATARAIEHSGHYDDALARVVNARAAAEAITYRPLHAELELQDGIVRSRLGKYPDAERALRESLRIATTARQWGTMQDAAAVLVSVVGAYQQRFDEATSYADLGLGLAGGDPIRESRVHNNLAIGLLPQGRLAEAEAEQRRALELRERVLDPDDPALATTRANLANVLTESGRHAEAEQELRDALALLEGTLGPEHPTVALQLNNLALSLTSQGRHAEAEIEARRALALKQKVLGPDHPEVATSIDAIANILFAEGKYEESIAMHCEGIALEVRVLGHDHLRSAQSRTNLAAVYEARGDWAALEAETREVLAIREKGLPPDHPELAATRVSLASALLRRGAIAEARPLAEAGWERRQRDDMPPRKRGVAAWVLARIYWEGGAADDRTRAIALAERAVVDLAAGGEDPEEVADWLAARK